MLILSLMLSVCAFATVVGVSSGSGGLNRARNAAIGWSFAGVISTCVGLLPIAYAIHIVGTVIVCVVACELGFSRRRLLHGCVLAFGVAYLITGGFAAYLVRSELDRYPIVSLENRLAYEAGQTEPINRFPDVTDLEASYEADSRRKIFDSFRSGSLRQLHERTYERFVMSPGFGLARMIRWPIRKVDIPVIPLPQSRIERDYFQPESLTGDPFEGPDLAEYHRNTQADFTSLNSFGYVADFRQAAGFVPHHVRLPALDVHRLELISLLKFPEPAVYVTENFPRMDELADAPTRPLDEFESRHLPALRAGEETKAERFPDGIRMLGAIRAVRQCQGCHDAKPGELLGAFSYEIEMAAGRPDFLPEADDR